MLNLTDLKQQGLTLSKADAQELHGPINNIAQRGGDSDVVFAALPKEDKSDYLKEYYNELQQENIRLKKENLELKQAAKPGEIKTPERVTTPSIITRVKEPAKRGPKKK